MKINKLTYMASVALLGFAMSSCNDFLDRPAEDTYNVDNFYQTDEQCYQGVNYLYNSPWYDFQRGFIKVGEVMSGNYYIGSSPYLTFTLNGTDEDLVNMSCSLWAVVGHTSVVYNNLKNSPATPSVVNACMGECLTWRAMAYFYLVRTFGEVPIIHDTTSTIADGSYNDVQKVVRADVYEYIIMTLEKAMELLPKSVSQKGRIDYYCAEALLAKVYLTKAGLNMSGSRSTDDLAKAAKYAKDVIDNSGRQLLDNYADVFRMENNENEESLIAWRWSSGRDPWTQQNTLQSDIAPVGFSDFGDCWGTYQGMSVDLQDAFNYNVLSSPETRIDVDTRRHATMMGPGDTYSYFWTDKGGFDLLKFFYDEDYGKGGPGMCNCPTGTYPVKHLYGDTYDHEQALGTSPANMAYGLATHILRLSDVYLIYAEAVLGNNASTSDGEALAAFNAVRSRAIPTATPVTSITFDDVWKERRLELAFEGDRWYDYVRLSYYDVDRAISEIKAQRRDVYWNLESLFKYYYQNGVWDIQKAATSESSGEAGYNTDPEIPNVTASSFTIPMSTDDVVFNPNLGSSVPAISVDVRSEYSY